MRASASCLLTCCILRTRGRSTTARCSSCPRPCPCPGRKRPLWELEARTRTYRMATPLSPFWVVVATLGSPALPPVLGRRSSSRIRTPRSRSRRPRDRPGQAWPQAFSCPDSSRTHCPCNCSPGKRCNSLAKRRISTGVICLNQSVFVAYLLARAGRSADAVRAAAVLSGVAGTALVVRALGGGEVVWTAFVLRGVAAASGEIFRGH